MTVRHLAAVNNLDEDGYVVDPGRVYHGAIVGGRISALAGVVDPSTHINLDYRDHEVGDCVIVDDLVEGASVVRDGDGQFMHAPLHPDAMRRLGPVDLGARRAEWLRAFAPPST